MSTQPVGPPCPVCDLPMAETKAGVYECVVAVWLRQYAAESEAAE